ncbi:hypothetical protein quinque_006585 [Culex quinquefasciatus]
MKVPFSAKYVNHTNAAALRLFAKMANRPDVLATAFFIESLAKWFSLSTNRSRVLAFSKANKEAYDKAVGFMQFMRKFIFTITVGEDKRWKPWQAALILNVNSVLRLQAYFLDVRGFKFVLTGRLTQDCVENLFSQIRIRQKKPNALQVKNILKNICVAQLMDDVQGSSYEFDDQPKAVVKTKLDSRSMS